MKQDYPKYQMKALMMARLIAYAAEEPGNAGSKN